MSWDEYLILLVCCSATILACRVVPLFLFRGRELSLQARSALGLIPAAAFAALVANDLLKLELFATGPWQGCIPFIAAAVVAVVAVKTRNLVACVVVGVAVYGLLMLVPL